MIRVAPLLLTTLMSSWSTTGTAAERSVVQDDETLEWLDDYDDAIALAKETGKPLFLEFRCAP